MTGRTRKGRKRPAKVVIVGLGNTGSLVVENVARMIPLVDEIVLIDQDAYTRENLGTQRIVTSDIGRWKALVQRRELIRIDRRWRGRVSAIVDDVRNLPIERLRGDVMLLCLDSKVARLYAVEAAWRLGMPVVDAGVNAEEMLARVTVYVPGADAPCIECVWDERHYRTLEQVVPCRGGNPVTRPTNAPLSLGMLAAGLQAVECRRLLEGDPEVAAGVEVLLNAPHHRCTRTVLRRNPRCRFDHETWDIRRLDRAPEDITLDHVWALRNDAGSRGESVVLRPDRPLVGKIQCVCCGRIRELNRLRGRLRPRDRRCAVCDGDMRPVGFYMTDRLDSGRDSGLRHKSLRALGFLPGDVFSVGNDTHDWTHFTLGDGLSSGQIGKSRRRRKSC